MIESDTTADRGDAFPISNECLDREHVNSTLENEVLLYFQVFADVGLTISIILTNLILIASILQYRKHHKGTMRIFNTSVSMKFVVNLAASDLCMGLSVGLYAATHYSCDINEAFRSRYLCIFKFVPVCFAQINSSLSLIAIAVDRYIAVFRSFRYRDIMTDRTCYVIIAGVWTFALFYSHVLYFWNYWRPGTFCSMEDVIPLEYVISLDSFFHVSVLFMVGGIHYKLHRKACESNSQRSSIVSSETASNIKSTRLVILVIGVYLLCWAPYCVVNIIGMTETEESRFIYYAARIVYPIRNSYSLINPFVYAWKNLEIRTCVQWFFRRLRC